MLPEMVNELPIYAYDFDTNVVPGEQPENSGYWRDVGTIDAYYEANMDLRSIKPALNLYNYQWPLRTAEYSEGPVKFTFDEEGRRGIAMNSIVCEGCILAGAEVRDSVLGRRVFVDNGAEIVDSIVMDNCHIGAGARIRRTIVDKNARIPDGVRIGYDLERDRTDLPRYRVGIVVVEGTARQLHWPPWGLSKNHRAASGRCGRSFPPDPIVEPLWVMNATPTRLWRRLFLPNAVKHFAAAAMVASISCSCELRGKKRRFILRAGQIDSRIQHAVEKPAEPLCVAVRRRPRNSAPGPH